MNTSGKDISAALGAILPRVVSLRQQLHQIPELMYQEVKTAGLIRQYCASFGLKCQTVPEGCPTATYVMIGDPALPCVALRADIDALPIQEETQVAYRSGHAGYMHACGHDGHAAALVGAGAVLQQFAQAMPVCVKLIWQPAEEGGGGARRLVDAGILDGRLGPKVRAIFGLHGWPGLPVGNIATRPGPLMASVDNFHAMFVGRGAHGAFPHLGRDPIVAAAEAVLGLQQIISRELDPVAPAVITVGQISGGSAVNIIPSTATIAGTSRAITPETREYIKEAIERRLKGIAAAHDLRLELKWTEGYPPTINDPGMTEYLRQRVQATLGVDAFIPAANPTMGGEDFGYYLENVPGCFFFLGLAAGHAADAAGLHHPHFNFNDEALPVAIRMFVDLVMNSRG